MGLTREPTRLTTGSSRVGLRSGEPGWVEKNSTFSKVG